MVENIKELIKKPRTQATVGGGAGITAMVIADLGLPSDSSVATLLDAFLDSALFLGLMGVAISAASLFLVVIEAARKTEAERALSSNEAGRLRRFEKENPEKNSEDDVAFAYLQLQDRKHKAATQRVTNLVEAAYRMFLALKISTLGLLSTVLSDALFEDSPEEANLGATGALRGDASWWEPIWAEVLTVLRNLQGFPDEIPEALIGGALAAAAMVLIWSAVAIVVDDLNAERQN
ncbi:MAG: hypothetical protein RIM33_11515 [Alphaproteobacteria bacterium]